MAWRSQRMPLFALGLGVLLASAALPTSHASACTTKPTIPYGSFPDGCEGQDSVSGTCDDGYTGVISAACEGSVWVYAGTCTPVQHNYCTGQPTAPYASFPDNCDGQDSVTGACYGGYEGVVTATCENGVWVYAGVCTPVQHKYCTGKPTVPYGSFPDNCDGQDSVTGTCDDGYEGVITASCENGVWVTAGVCTPVQHNYCTGKPVVQYGVFPDNCEGKDYVKGQCWLGYTGSISATCTSGQWVVEGECLHIDYPKCTGTPQYDYGYFPDNCDGKDRVDGCCNDGYEGDLYATCEYGGWVIHSSCKKSQPPPDTCSGTPQYEYGYFPDNCDGNYVDGFCNDGYEGDIYAKCIMGVWRIYGECKPYCPYNCQGKPPHVDGIYWPGSSSNKHYAKACCKPGYQQGYVEAKCECGTWVIYGTCEKSEGCYGTPDCQPYAKNWSWNKCNGKSECYTKCNGGCGGGGYHAYCVNGEWQVTGSCQPKRPSFRGPKQY